MKCKKVKGIRGIELARSGIVLQGVLFLKATLIGLSIDPLSTGQYQGRSGHGKANL